MRKLPIADPNLTEGPLWSNILLFSIPLIFSQLLQVLFNMADVAIVGKFAGAIPLGSVGSTTMMVYLFTGFLIGMGAGVNVVVAKYLGARQHRDTEQSVHTAFLLCLAVGVILMILGVTLSPALLRLMKTKEDLLPGAIAYFQIYCLGMPAAGMFNFGSAVLSACGDTKRPLLYLSAAGVLNCILNLFFVIVLHMAAEGVAIASTISQFVSAGLLLIRMCRMDGECAVCFKKLRFYPGKTREILILSIPSGMQNAIFATANMFIQSGVNSFSSVMVEGSSAAANADTLIFNTQAAFYTACSSFIGQNWGAGKHDRMKKSYLWSVCYAVLIGALFGVAAIFRGRPFLYLFTNEPEVVEFGMERLKIMGISYWMSPFMDCTIAASRGIGKSVVPTVIVILGSCVFRIVWVYTVFAYFGTIASLFLLYLFSWGITAVFEILYFFVSYRKTVRNEVI